MCKCILRLNTNVGDQREEGVFFARRSTENGRYVFQFSTADAVFFVTVGQNAALRREGEISYSFPLDETHTAESQLHTPYGVIPVRVRTRKKEVCESDGELFFSAEYDLIYEEYVQNCAMRFTAKPLKY